MPLKGRLVTGRPVRVYLLGHPIPQVEMSDGSMGPFRRAYVTADPRNVAFRKWRLRCAAGSAAYTHRPIAVSSGVRLRDVTSLRQLREIDRAHLRSRRLDGDGKGRTLCMTYKA